MNKEKIREDLKKALLKLDEIKDNYLSIDDTVLNNYGLSHLQDTAMRNIDGAIWNVTTMLLRL